MKNPFTALKDRSKAIEAAEALYLLILQAEKQAGHSTGVDLPNDTEGGVAVLHHLLRLHPDVVVVRTAKNMTLTLDKNLRQGTGKEIYDHFKHAGVIFGKGQEDK